MPVEICGKNTSPTKWWFDDLGIPGFPRKKNSKVWFAVCPGLMNSPVISAQLFHLPRFPASAWQRKAKLASVYDCDPMTVFDSVELNHIDSSAGTVALMLPIQFWPSQALLLRLMSLAVCFFPLFIIRRWIPPDRMSPEERRPNDNTAKVFQMKWSILGHFLGADQEVLTIYHDGNDIQEIFSREVVTT